MRATSIVRVALATALMVAGLGIAGPAWADDLDVTSQGVSFAKSQDTSERSIEYSIRSLESWQYEWLTEDFSGRRSYVPFTSARQAMPDGYCVVYVRVPGAGEWHEHLGGARCTDGTTPAPSPTGTPPSVSPSPSQTAPSNAAPPPDPTDESASEPAPSLSPSHTASPSPSPSVSPTPSQSLSPSPVPSDGESPGSSPVGDALSSSFSGDLPDVGTHDLASRVGPDISSDPWAMTGLILAVAGLGTAGLIVWRSRHRAG